MQPENAGMQRVYTVPMTGGWAAIWEATQQRYYYYHQETGTTTWEPPAQATPMPGVHTGQEQQSTSAKDAGALHSDSAKEVSYDPEQLRFRHSNGSSSSSASSSSTNTSTDNSTNDSSKRFIAPDGNIFEWSHEKGDWELISSNNKGGGNKGKTANGQRHNSKPPAKKRRKRRASENTTVYFSGVPKDTTIEEVHSAFKLYGVIKTSLATGAPLIKLYQDAETGALKGDGTVTYLQRPSVENCIRIFDGAPFRPGCVIRVQEASFGTLNKRSNNSGESQSGGSKKRTQPSTGARPVITERKRKVQKLKEAQALSWEEGEAEHKGLKIVVLKNLFDPAVDFAGSEASSQAFERRLERAVASECLKCGELEKLTLYSSHPDGVMIARFKHSYAAEKCVTHASGGRWKCGGRVVTATYWDGEENFEQLRDYSEEDARVEAFGSWLEEQDPEEHLTELDRQAAKSLGNG